MSKYRTNGLSRGVRVAGAAAVAAVATGLLSTGAANADVFVPLPDGHKAGPGVNIARTGERALISPSLAANGAGRVVWVSGNAIADVAVTPEGEIGPNNGPTGNPGTNNSSTHGASQLNTGYIVGCQVSIADDAISAGVSGSVNLSGASAGGSIGINLGPGEVKFVQIDYKDILK
uniref:MspA family porin n=1 Tax=Nocardia asiatica TaxID=209252 RepID=UPI00245548ED